MTYSVFGATLNLALSIYLSSKLYETLWHFMFGGKYGKSKLYGNGYEGTKQLCCQRHCGVIPAFYVLLLPVQLPH